MRFFVPLFLVSCASPGLHISTEFETEDAENILEAASLWQDAGVVLDIDFSGPLVSTVRPWRDNRIKNPGNKTGVEFENWRGVSMILLTEPVTLGTAAHEIGHFLGLHHKDEDLLMRPHNPEPVISEWARDEVCKMWACLE